MKDSSVRRWSALHKGLYRATGGLLGRRLVGNDMLLLTTRGHRTGKDHTVPLLYLRDGSHLVVVASYGGRPRNPAWYHNLVAEPTVQVQVNARVVAMLARTASPDERALWWPRIVDAYESYADYESGTDREIPVVILEPIERRDGGH